MKIAVFGDINSNLNYLKVFYAQTKAEGVEKYMCDGDIIHHNSPTGIRYSNDCISLIRESGTIACSSNHDELCGKLERFISRENLDYLRTRPGFCIDRQVIMVHDCLRHSNNSKIKWYNKRDLPRFQARQEFEYLKNEFPGQRVIFVGHTHKRFHFQNQVNIVRVNYLPEFNKQYDVSKGLHLVNPGTIGYALPPWGFGEVPSYLVYDDRAETITFKKLQIPHPVRQSIMMSLGDFCDDVRYGRLFNKSKLPVA